MVTSSPVCRAAATAVSERLLKTCGVLDQMIRGQHDHRRLGVARRDPADAECDRRRGVALRGLGDDVLRAGRFFASVADGGILIGVREDEDVLRGHESVETR